jgi:hypothetical protein
MNKKSLNQVFKLRTLMHKINEEISCFLTQFFVVRSYYFQDVDFSTSAISFISFGTFSI